MACDPWPIVVDPVCCPGWDQLPEAQRNRAVRLATEIIWALSGRQFSVCSACVRPCETFCLRCPVTAARPGTWGLQSTPGYGWREGGGAMGGCGCGCAGSGGCKSACAVRLDPAPVIAITQVTVGGQVVPASEYHVLDGNVLVRRGSGCWPRCNDLAAAASTWSVTYSYGTAASAVALDMAAILACEIGKFCANQKCRLSGRITQLSRDGVSITLDPNQFIDHGLTSLPEVDQWLRVVNPYGLAQRGEVWSPDVIAPRQVTWPTATC